MTSPLPTYLESIQAIAHALAAAETVDSVLDVAVAQVPSCVGAAMAVAALCGVDGLHVVHHTHARPRAEWTDPMVVDARSPIAAAVRENRTLRFRTRTPHLTPFSDPAALDDMDGARLVVPLRGQHGVLGALVLLYSTPRAFSNNEVLYIETLTQSCALALERVWGDARRHKAIGALHESDALYRILADANVLGIYTADSERLLHANDCLLRMMEYTREDLEHGRITWEHLKRPGYDDQDALIQKELALYGCTNAHERVVQRRDGTQMPMLFGVALVRADPPQVVGYVIDLTEIRQAQEALRQNEERFRLAVDGAGIGTSHWNLRTGECQWGGAQAAIYGFADDRHLTLEGVLARIHPDDRAKIEARMARLQAGDTDGGTEFRIVWPDGSIHWALSRGRVYPDEEGRPLRYEGITLDIDVSKRAEAEIAALNSRLSRSIQETHHRIKNNLQYIAAMLDVSGMQDGGVISAENERRIVAHIQTLARIHDVLTESVGQANSGEAILAGGAIERVLAMLAESLNQTIDLETERISLSMQRITALNLVLAELITNAAKYGDGRICVALKRKDDAGHLSVKNGGAGLPHGFDVRTHAHMGLLIAQQMVTHDLLGTLSFDRPVSGGTEAVVTFPIAEAAASAQPISCG